MSHCWKRIWATYFQGNQSVKVQFLSSIKKKKVWKEKEVMHGQLVTSQRTAHCNHVQRTVLKSKLFKVITALSSQQNLIMSKGWIKGENKNMQPISKRKTSRYVQAHVQKMLIKFQQGKVPKIIAKKCVQAKKIRQLKKQRLPTPRMSPADLKSFATKHQKRRQQSWYFLHTDTRCFQNLSDDWSVRV